MNIGLETSPVIMRQRWLDDRYTFGLYWILREKAGMGGWPPRDIDRVCGWLVVRLLADLFNKSPREVAADLIECHKHYEER